MSSVIVISDSTVSLLLKGGVPKRSKSRSSASKTPEFYSTRPALESNDQQMPSYNVRGAPSPMCSPTSPVHPFV